MAMTKTVLILFGGVVMAVSYAMAGYSNSYQNQNSVGNDQGNHGWDHHQDYHSKPSYKYSYGVSDHHTKDYKHASEHRDGDHVQGQYSLLEPDGHWRTVTYVADKGGFRANVHRSHGHHGWESGNNGGGGGGGGGGGAGGAGGF